jgi:hypothetical protein
MAERAEISGTPTRLIVNMPVVMVAVPYPDASVVNALRKRCGRNGKECRDSYRKDVSAHKHLHHIIALKLPADCICYLFL